VFRISKISRLPTVHLFSIAILMLPNMRVFLNLLICDFPQKYMAISHLERKRVDGTYGLSSFFSRSMRVIFLTEKVAEKRSAERNYNFLHTASTSISQPTSTCFRLSQLLQKGHVLSFLSSDGNSGISNVHRSWVRSLPCPALHLSFSPAVTLHSSVGS